MTEASQRSASPSVPKPAGPPWPAGLFRMEGTYRSHCVILPLEIARVRAMLPAGLTLGHQSLTPAGRHPVLLMFGHHSGVRPTFLPISGGAYDELVLAVPFLERLAAANDYGGPFSYMPRLYLNAWLWVILGWFYGYAKSRARILASAESYAVDSLLGARPLVSATFSPRSHAAPANDFPFFDQVAPIFRQPFASRVLGITICSVMTFHLERAKLQAVDACVELRRSFVAGLPVETFAAPGIDTGPLGAFWIEVPWTLSFPFCCSLKGAAS